MMDEANDSKIAGLGSMDMLSCQVGIGSHLEIYFDWNGDMGNTMFYVDERALSTCWHQSSSIYVH